MGIPLGYFFSIPVHDRTYLLPGFLGIMKLSSENHLLLMLNITCCFQGKCDKKSTLGELQGQSKEDSQVLLATVPKVLQFIGFFYLYWFYFS